MKELISVKSNGIRVSIKDSRLDIQRYRINNLGKLEVDDGITPEEIPDVIQLLTVAYKQL